MHITDANLAGAPLYIESLDQEGRGIARREGKAIFVEGALPGEQVSVSVYRKKPSFELANVQAILKASPARLEPRCAHFGRCGGCALQHMNVPTQVAAKQRTLEDALWHIGKLKPDVILAPIYGAPWEYRHRARFTVRHVPKKGGVLVGFHEKRSSYVADMTSCEVVPGRISALLLPLREVIGRLSIRHRVPQIELAVGEGADVLVLRILDALSAEDKTLLKAFAEQFRLHLYLQPAGPDTARPLDPETPVDLHYLLPEFDVRIYFDPTDFTQVNHAVNRLLVRRALRLLAPQPGERVADLFCGLGNFSLPIARSGALVLGLEGSRQLVARARTNATRNDLADRVRFESMNLSEIDSKTLAALGSFDGMLIDPPRDGAFELVNALGKLPPARIVYVSCNPATLARDGAVLVRDKGYALKSAGIINMFPHTAHVESLALFQRQEEQGRGDP
ncbi:MAG: rRNA m(5)U939 methyltransferase [Betaproteobacteria bacterium]|jgi:23S rRNA (uracil1939-C5)-methyltransferase|nr:rRNA m(5)U939 methyltransferase [Betaproteobacteria bacterium]